MTDTRAQKYSREALIANVAVACGVPVEAMAGRTRSKAACTARHLAMLAERQEFPGLSLREIGDDFGGRDHSTVIHGIGAALRLLRESEWARYRLNGAIRAWREAPTVKPRRRMPRAWAAGRIWRVAVTAQRAVGGADC